MKEKRIKSVKAWAVVDKRCGTIFEAYASRSVALEHRRSAKEKTIPVRITPITKARKK